MPELLLHYVSWLSVTLSVSTGYSSVGLTSDSPRHDLFEDFDIKGPKQNPPAVRLQGKVLQTYVKLKEKEEKRKKWKRTEVVSGNSKWAILL
jgi:hypothetical protein